MNIKYYYNFAIWLTILVLISCFYQSVNLPTDQKKIEQTKSKIEVQPIKAKSTIFSPINEAKQKPKQIQSKSVKMDKFLKKQELKQSSLKDKLKKQSKIIPIPVKNEQNILQSKNINTEEKLKDLIKNQLKTNDNQKKISDVLKDIKKEIKAKESTKAVQTSNNQKKDYKKGSDTIPTLTKKQEPIMKKTGESAAKDIKAVEYTKAVQTSNNQKKDDKKGSDTIPTLTKKQEPIMKKTGESVAKDTKAVESTKAVQTSNNQKKDDKKGSDIINERNHQKNTIVEQKVFKKQKQNILTDLANSMKKHQLKKEDSQQEKKIFFADRKQKQREKEHQQLSSNKLNQQIIQKKICNKRLQYGVIIVLIGFVIAQYFCYSKNQNDQQIEKQIKSKEQPNFKQSNYQNQLQQNLKNNSFQSEEQVSLHVQQN